VKAYDVLVSGRRGGDCVCEVFFVLAADAALLFAMEMQHVAQVFSEVPDCVYRELNAEVRGVGIRDRDLKGGFSAAVELAQQCFAVEQPRIGQPLRFWCVHWLYDVVAVWIFQTSLTSETSETGKRSLGQRHNTILYDIYCLML